MRNNVKSKIERLLAAMHEESREEERSPTPTDATKGGHPPVNVTVYDFSNASVCVIVDSDGATVSSN